MSEDTGVSTGLTCETANNLISEVSKIVVGQYEFIENLVIVMLSGGHALIEGVPGLAKTLTAKTLAKAINADFKRIQFTPDLMPADITGTKIFDAKSAGFFFKKGSLFTNILLADEINRTPPKTQSALLEAMEEKSITIDGETNVLDELFMVIATQNPIEYEGTYPLPEAQVDRFMMKLLVDYVPQKFENMVLENYNEGFDAKDMSTVAVNKVCDPETIRKCRKEISGVRADNGIINYITSITRATRNSPSLMLGASPRASISLLQASKTYAAMQGRDYITPDDIKELALPVMRHRIILKPEAGLEGISNDEVIKSILSRIEVPR